MIAQDTQRDISTVTPNTAALKLNCCLRGISAKFRTTISYAGRQDARNVRGHFSKAQRCGSQSSSDSCLATLHYLIFIYIIFNTLTLIPRSHPGFSPKRVQHFRGEGGGGGEMFVCFLPVFWKQLSSAKKNTELESFLRAVFRTGRLLLPASILHHNVHLGRLFLKKYLSRLLPFVSILPDTRRISWRDGLHRLY